MSALLRLMRGPGSLLAPALVLSLPYFSSFGTCHELLSPKSLDAGLVARDPSTDPLDFSWIKNWAALGDSFTAGIGSGMVWNGGTNKDDVSCSRYDLSYPAILNNFFGPSVQNFKFMACTNANSNDIFGQAKSLPDDSQDLIVMTAGGNDLCLSSILWACIMSSQTTMTNCQSTIDSAQNWIDSTLGNNLDQVIDRAIGALNNGGVFVYALYAQYFNAEADAPCHNDEDWVFPGTAGSGSLLLTTDIRSKLNQLVVNANNVIKQAVHAAQDHYRNANVAIEYADWDGWLDGESGRFCEPGETPNPSDSANANCHFFKLNTKKTPPINSKRSLQDDFVFGTMDNDTVFHEHPLQPLAAVSNHSLHARDPAQPSCSGGPPSWLIDDDLGSIFHPNQLGHLTIASFVGNAIAVGRAKILGVPNPDCGNLNKLTCFQQQGSKEYASAWALYSQTADFCKSAVDHIPSNTANWAYSKSYYDDLPEAVLFNVQLQNGGESITFDQCQTSINQILDGCDGNDPKNPLNWKFGGEQETEQVKWTIQPTKQGRVFPPYKSPVASCETHYAVVKTNWKVYGGGFAGWDYGQQSVLPNISHCFGANPTGWEFTYLDEPDGEGNEWYASGSGALGLPQRCLTSIIGGSGGPYPVHCS